MNCYPGYGGPVAGYPGGGYPQAGYGTTGGFVWLPILLLFILILAIFPFFSYGK